MANLLQYEDSPYLQQHKDNPVNWYPWCDEAFEKAKNENKAIFISIGYSSCHWCHVMEHEVFENEAIAAYLNEHFVSIKVDKEERPDIDKHYQEVHMLLNRRAGGWPTSIFATPQNKAFYAATYIPPQPQPQMMGFMQLIEIIAPKIAENDEKLFQNADEIESYLRPADKPTEATRLQLHIVDTFVKQAGHNYEKAYGGFSVSPKFPHTSTLTALLHIAGVNGYDEAREMVRHTLEQMQLGGMYDLVEGGFCRYSTDERWLVPHFEKMTYDNGLLIELYAKASQQLDDSRFLTTAKESADFMLDKMAEDHLFYSASDADTEGEEGKYFVYDYEEVVALLNSNDFHQEQIDTITETLSVSADGNFEGRNVIQLTQGERPEWFSEVMALLRSLRQERTYPFIDKKVQVSWNAMMISALFTLGDLDRSYRDAAVKHLERVLETMMIGGRLYHSALIHKQPKVEAFLEDYAYLGRALMKGYESTFDERYLVLAQQLANTALGNYYEEGHWYFSKGEFVTEADIGDSSYPGSVGVMVDLLLSLGTLIDPKYRHFAFKTLEYYSQKLAKTPIYFPYMLDQAFRYQKEDRIIKAPAALLTESTPLLSQVDYPYTKRYASSESEGFMVCGLQSCFANCRDAEQINGLIRDSLQAP
ncbi:thioredoxin domain-containing protein [Sulfurimonas sp. HSL3-7]|uniref:thioredoxin domain-containing protein n=1 Tax=Sulfonitrofixus jiaomeiensis TaxID=3131938 RepID=UPI0031F94A54